MHTPSVKSQPGIPWAAWGCAVAGVVLFQFWGNATRGYIDTASLFYWWAYQWVNPASETQHGWLVLGLSGWLFWRNARELPADRTARGPAGAALLGGLALHALGLLTQQARISIAALLLFTWGALTLAGGRRWGRAAAFPLLFMLFAVPVNFLDTAAFWLRMWVIDAGSALARAVGLDVVRNGTQLLAPDGRFQYEVAAACSGVRSLVALVALATLAGYLRLRPWGWRVGVALLALPFAYVGNVVRITAILVAAHWGGQHAGEVTHEWAGGLVYAVVLALVLAVLALVRRRWPQVARPEGTAPAAPWWLAPEPAEPPARDLRLAGGVVLLAAGLAVGAQGWLAQRAEGTAGVRLAPDGRNPVELPTWLDRAWLGSPVPVSPVEREVLPPDTGFSRKLYTPLLKAGSPVLFSVVLSGRDRSSIHRPEVCLVGQGWTIEQVEEQVFPVAGHPAGAPLTVLHVRREVVRPDGRRVVVPGVVVYGFVGRDRIVATQAQRLWRGAWAGLQGQPERWAYVLLQTDATDGPAAARARLQEVWGRVWPALRGAGG